MVINIINNTKFIFEMVMLIIYILQLWFYYVPIKINCITKDNLNINIDSVLYLMMVNYILYYILYPMVNVLLYKCSMIDR